MNLIPANSSLLITLSLCATAFLLSGCAVHYFDSRTGTEHLWGLGHLKMKTAPASGTRLLGLSVRGGRDDYGVTAGWEARSRVTMPPSGTLLLQWPTNSGPLPREMRDLFTIRIGTNLPPGWEIPPGTVSTNQPTNQPNHETKTSALPLPIGPDRLRGL